MLKGITADIWAICRDREVFNYLFFLSEIQEENVFWQSLLNKNIYSKKRKETRFYNLTL